jgi:hypothetical protein
MSKIMRIVLTSLVALVLSAGTAFAIPGGDGGWTNLPGSNTGNRNNGNGGKGGGPSHRLVLKKSLDKDLKMRLHKSMEGAVGVVVTDVGVAMIGAAGRDVRISSSILRILQGSNLDSMRIVFFAADGRWIDVRVSFIGDELVLKVK